MAQFSVRCWIHGLDKQMDMKYYCPQDHVLMALEALESVGNHPELLWRASRACLFYRRDLITKNNKFTLQFTRINNLTIKRLDEQMMSFAEKCLEMPDTNTNEPETSRLTSHFHARVFKAVGLWIKASKYSKNDLEEVSLLKECKTLLDECIEEDGSAWILTLYRGLWSFKVATAVTLIDKISFGITNFQSLPSASINDALDDLLKSIYYSSQEMKTDRPTLLLVSKCYHLKKDIPRAREYLNKAIECDILTTPDGEDMKDLMQQLVKDFMESV